MSKNNRIHAINSIAERVPDAPSASLPADMSMATYGEDVFGEKEMRIVGDLILKAVFDFDVTRGEILSMVDKLCTEFPLY